jgi:hypothetical protein
MQNRSDGRPWIPSGTPENGAPSRHRVWQLGLSYRRRRRRSGRRFRSQWLGQSPSGSRRYFRPEALDFRPWSFLVANGVKLERFPPRKHWKEPVLQLDRIALKGQAKGHRCRSMVEAEGNEQTVCFLRPSTPPRLPPKASQWHDLDPCWNRRIRCRSQSRLSACQS